MKYYLSLDQDGYLLSVFTSSHAGKKGSVGAPFVESIEDIDLSGNRISAYRFNGTDLVFDEERYREIVALEEQQDAEINRVARKENARFEITDAVLTATINTIEVDDTTALRWIDFYPEWSGNTPYSVGFKTTYQDRLWRCIQAHTSQVGWEPTNVPALWEEICESHSGIIDDPIPYNNNMTLENGKYYSQFDVTYHCIRDTGVPVYNNLADLVGLYVEIA